MSSMQRPSKVSTHASVRRRLPKAITSQRRSNCFNSRLREEATHALRDLNEVARVSTHASVRRRLVRGQQQVLRFRFQLTPP